MKIGLITFHFVNNFGGALQTYSLQKYIKNNFNVDSVHVIDYRNWFIRFTDTVRLFPITKNKKAFISGLKTMGQRLHRKKKFDSFLKENVLLSKKYRSSIGLKLCPPKYDGFVCGSDQIWNPIITGGVTPAYYLSFVKNRNRVCSYAPSFGTSKISPIFEKKMKKYISSIGKLSVREHQAALTIDEWLDVCPTELIDPTFLIENETWDEISHINVKLPEHYILIYVMQSNYKIYDYAKQIMDIYNLPVVDISRYGYNPGYISQTLIDVGPSEFIYLFKNADIVCTNSYHGLAYSLIFRKKLYLLPCKSFSARIMNLLDLLQIDKSSVCDEDSVNELIYNPAYVEEVISKKKEEAYIYLNDFIKGLKEC
ncbi:MAG: polysaccharide pyruvyl transferase family protein [Lachnospiraceae bacterium]|nr:polysaccharide pyruvyl transferase family protein [Lachnospiraceae bacterium]